MIITRTPLRMSFVGGGSDLPAYYEKFGGAVISTAIDKYVFVTVNKKFDDALRLSYSKTELVKSVSEIEHTIVRAALTHVGITGGLEITSIGWGLQAPLQSACCMLCTPIWASMSHLTGLETKVVILKLILAVLRLESRISLQLPLVASILSDFIVTELLWSTH